MYTYTADYITKVGALKYYTYFTVVPNPTTLYPTTTAVESTDGGGW